MGIVIIGLLMVLILISIHKLDKTKDEPKDELMATMDAIAKKLGVSEQEIGDSLKKRKGKL